MISFIASILIKEINHMWENNFRWFVGWSASGVMGIAKSSQSLKKRRTDKLWLVFC